MIIIYPCNIHIASDVLQFLLEVLPTGRCKGYEIYSTRSTCRVLNENGVPAKHINKVECESPNLLDLILSHEIDLVIDTPAQGIERSKDGFIIRRHAIETGVPVLTSLDTADALLTSLEKANKDHLTLVDICEL